MCFKYETKLFWKITIIFCKGETAKEKGNFLTPFF